MGSSVCVLLPYVTVSFGAAEATLFTPLFFRDNNYQILSNVSVVFSVFVILLTKMFKYKRI